MSNLIVNGGLEITRDICPKSFCQFTSTQGNIDSWQLASGPKLELNFRTDMVPHGGDWSSDLNAFVAFSISQQISIPTAGTYSVSFWARSNTRCPESINKRGFSSINGKTTSFETNSETWKQLTYDIHLDKSTQTFVIGGDTSPGFGDKQCGPAVDDISIVLKSADTIPAPDVANVETARATSDSGSGNPNGQNINNQAPPNPNPPNNGQSSGTATKPSETAAAAQPSQTTVSGQLNTGNRAQLSAISNDQIVDINASNPPSGSAPQSDSPAFNSPSSPANNPSDSSNTQQTIIISVFSVALVFLVCLVIYYKRRTKKRSQETQDDVFKRARFLNVDGIKVDKRESELHGDSILVPSLRWSWTNQMSIKSGGSSSFWVVGSQGTAVEGSTRDSVTTASARGSALAPPSKRSTLGSWQI